MPYKSRCKALMLSPLIVYALAASITFGAVSLFGYWSHRWLHNPRAGKAYKSHLKHHSLYPISDYQSEVYRSAGKDNSGFLFAAMSIPVVALPIGLSYFGKISWGMTSFIVSEMIFLGWLHDYLHDDFHIEGHWLNRFSFFRKWGRLHRQHHKNVKTNYSIFSFIWDRVFQSYYLE